MAKATVTSTYSRSVHYTDAQIQMLQREIVTLRHELDDEHKTRVNRKFVAHNAGIALGVIIIIITHYAHFTEYVDLIALAPNPVVECIDRYFRV